MMADSVSDLESDASSVDCGPVSKNDCSSVGPEQMVKRIESLLQENRVLKMELDTYRFKCKSLEEENRELKKARVTIQVMAEQQEEFISNTLLKKIQALKNEKEQLARNYEQEEEFLTNDLSRKLFQLRQEKCELEVTLEREQEYQVNKLMRRIEKLQGEVTSKQSTLEQLKKDKVELENQLEQEQEALVNRLWKRMDKLEAEKRMLQQKLDQPVSEPPSPRDSLMNVDEDTAGNLVVNIQTLKNEVSRLHAQLMAAQNEHKEKMVQYAEEERQIREENVRLQRKLQMEIERREQLCRHLSESESSLEMDDERHFNEMTKHHEKMQCASTGGSGGGAGRPRTVSSPIPLQHSNSRSISPGMLGPSSPLRSGMMGPLCHSMGPHCHPGPIGGTHHLPGPHNMGAHCLPSSLPTGHTPLCAPAGQMKQEKFAKPNAPPPTSGHSTGSVSSDTSLTTRSPSNNDSMDSSKPA